MKKLFQGSFFLSILFLILIASPAWSTNFFVSPAGDNSSAYTTWAKAANLPDTATVRDPGVGPHTVYIGPGPYAGQLSISSWGGDWDSVTIQGVSAAGVVARCGEGGAYPATCALYPAASNEVIINVAAGQNGMSLAAAANVTVNDITVNGTPNTKYGLYTNTTSTYTLNRVRIIGSLGGAIKTLGVGGTTILNRCELLGANDNAQYMAAWITASTIFTTNYVLWKYGGNNLKYVVRSESSNAVVLNNNVFDMKPINDSNASILYNTGAGSITPKNSLFFPAKNLAVTTAGTIVIDSSNIVVPDWTYTNGTSGAGVTDNSTKALPKITTYGRSGYIIVSTDDVYDIPRTKQLAGLLSARGMKGTFYTKTLSVQSNTAAILDIGTTYPGVMELGHHSYSHSDLSVTGNIWTVAGCTIANDRTGTGTITIAGGGSGTVTNVKTKTLTAIRAELVTGGCTVTDSLYSAAGATGKITGTTLGEALNTFAAGTTAPLLIDSTGATGLYKTEIVDSKATSESLLGVTLNSFAMPYNNTNANARTAIQTAGFTSARWGITGLGGAAVYNLENINVYTLAAVRTDTDLWADTDTEATVRLRANYLASSAAQGEILFLLDHGYAGGPTITQWGYALEEFAKYPTVSITSAYTAANIIRTSGDWTTADNITYTRTTWPDIADYHLQAGSPAINAGVDVGLSVDCAGRPIQLAPDIGAYETETRRRRAN